MSRTSRSLKGEWGRKLREAYVNAYSQPSTWVVALLSLAGSLEEGVNWRDAAPRQPIKSLLAGFYKSRFMTKSGTLLETEDTLVSGPVEVTRTCAVRSVF